MADNEEESNKTNCTALGELGTSAPASEQKSPASVSACSESNHVDGDGGEQTTISIDRDPSQVEAAHFQPSADAKEVIGPEVIGQILGGEIITSFVQTNENRESSEDAECATVSGDFLSALGPTTTIIYVQPDGSFVESSGLTAEEQQHLLEQLSKQQLVQVPNNEAARPPEQNEQPKPPHPTKPNAISSIDVQHVIDHVNKSQVQNTRSQNSVSQIVQKPVTTQPASYITLEAGNVISAPLTATIQSQPFTIVQNASQQLQSVAKHVAQQQSHSRGLSDQSKQAEPIHIQVQAPPKSEVSQRQAAPINILQPQSLPVSQPVVKVSNVGTVSTPQIIHITPVAGQQQYFLQNLGEPPIQLLLQKPAPVVGSISVPILQKVQTPVTSVSFATGTKSSATKPGAVSIPSTVILTPSSSSSLTTKVLTPSIKTTTVVTKMLTPANVKEKSTTKEKQKKPLKIQTRSGRVSRPPKHKVKDYKFIKNEDLAESHQSDSDDYSEISVEEEECEKGKKDEVDVFSLRNKAFKCEICEKSYIGLAGLNRHYKLNPSHDKSQASIAVDKEDSKLTEKDVVADVPKANPVTEATTQKAQEDSTREIERRRPGRPKGSGRSNLSKRLGRKPKRGRRGRPPKHQTTLTPEQQEERRRNRLTQLIEQYDDEDLMEIVLPRLAKVMTVWEFLLMKVENSFSSKQQFPSVYHEFEQLHSQVKKMADEHFSIAPASRPAVNINNVEVLKSLGITDPSNALALDLSQGQLVTSRSNQATKGLRSFENTKMLPPAKRFKMENCGSEVNHNGIQKHDEDPVLLREPQVLLTRLEELPDTDGTNEARTEDEPMDAGACSLETDAAKSQGDSDFSEVLHNSGNGDITNQVKELEEALSPDAKCEVLVQKIDENCESPQLSSLEETEAIEEPATCQVVIHSDQAEDEPQVFIQTAEGLVRQSAEELAAKGIVIVNGPDGSTVHIEAPEGVPLDAVHALLGIETEKKT